MLTLTRRSLLALGTAFSLSACGEFGTTTTVTTATPIAVDVTPAEMLAAINQVRQQNGSKPLVYSAVLADMARSQADAMVGHDQMSHDFGPGEALRDRANVAGYHGPIGENVAAGQRSVEEALKDWLASPGHRYTLLSDMWTSVGMVVMSARPGSKYGVFWAADFGTS
ncbi:MAG: CAP domain-containing protein [Devosia sp.]|nr:CAP domain-containing protein [Devosia sp.]